MKVNWLWMLCAALMLGAGVWDYAHRSWKTGTIALIYSAANAILATMKE